LILTEKEAAGGPFEHLAAAGHGAPTAAKQGADLGYRTRIPAFIAPSTLQDKFIFNFGDSALKRISFGLI